MSDKRFWFVIDKSKVEYVQDNVTGEKITVTGLEDLVNEQQDIISQLQDLCGESDYENAKLRLKNKKLKQILKDIVEVTDETYTKNRNMFKVTVVFDYKKYKEIRECLNE